MKNRLKQLLHYLTEGLVEREEAVKLTLLSAVAGESIFLYGPPGVGKSLIARRLKHVFSDGKSFEYLMTKFSTPEEIFGPISIKKLKEEDKYERLTEEYLPGANVVFLDEIWKSGPAIQNALLTILNERIYRNGTQEIHVNLHAIIGASNELPPEGESYGPLWDRFLIRYQVHPVKNASAFLKLISGNQNLYTDNIPPDLKISIEELRQWSQMADEVEIPDEVATAIRVIYEKLEEVNNRQTDIPPFQIYDRRWKKIVQLMKVSAVCHGRRAIHLSDVYLAVHCLWNHTSQIPILRKIVSETIREHGYNTAMKLSLLTAEIQRYENEILSETKLKVIDLTDVPRTVRDEFFPLEKCDDLPSATYLKIIDFKALSPGEFQVINFYDQDLKLVYRLQTSLGNRPYTIKVLHNSRTLTLDIQTVKQEVTRYVYKAPHPLVKAYWDEWGEKLEKFIDERFEWLQNNMPRELDDNSEHLFVDESILDLISENYTKTTSRLEQLKLRLEKARFQYSAHTSAEKVL
ncbi:AAA family ATPase [Schleiferia thermophila]|jgi:MoxR-like ATPase|uniref:AAA family ATPase n=1 Tax=Schleiferia thermophila TaxID=884107 RepID=UPI0004E6FC1C|nr:AAA family ATPase [Schleiferia thermophila]KFD38920.1 ATPase [Schleiferia thermophila str. Yellowstone]